MRDSMPRRRRDGDGGRERDSRARRRGYNVSPASSSRHTQQQEEDMDIRRTANLSPSPRSRRSRSSPPIGGSIDRESTRNPYPTFYTFNDKGGPRIEPSNFNDHYDGSIIPSAPRNSVQGLLVDRRPGYLESRAPLMPTRSPRTGYPSSQYHNNNPSGTINSMMPHQTSEFYEKHVVSTGEDNHITYDGTHLEKLYVEDECYPSTSQVPHQPRHYTAATSSEIAMEDSGGPSRGHLHLLPENEYALRGSRRFTDDHMDNKVYPRMHMVEHMGRPLSPSVRANSGHCDYNNVDLRATIDAQQLPAQEGLQRSMVWGIEGGHRDTLRSYFMDVGQYNSNHLETTPNHTDASFYWKENYSSRFDPLNARGINEDHFSSYSGTQARAEMSVTRSSDYDSIRERCGSERDPDIGKYGERPRYPTSPNHLMDTSDRNLSPSERILFRNKSEFYDQSPRRSMKRKYPIDRGIDRAPLDDLNSFRHDHLRTSGREQWYDENADHLFKSKRASTRHFKQRNLSDRLHRPDNQTGEHKFSSHAHGGHNTSLKNRLGPGPSEFSDLLHIERVNERPRMHKFWKRNKDDWHGGRYLHNDDAGDAMHLSKVDPPEDSEEFKKLANKAFLRFVRFFYGSIFQQKRYREPEKGNVLICLVCGSRSKEFLDTHCLVTHAYRSLKVGLRTDHLGLHKALCLLMGWNWRILPDDSRRYHVSPPEAKSLKEDLILWPPVVIIHNSSIGSKNNASEPRIITNEEMGNILSGMGLDKGKIQICKGKPANHSVLLVKFLPTLSGLQEAEKLHNHYAGTSYGRQEFDNLVLNRVGSETTVPKGAEGGDFLYGYMALVEDLDKIDPITKKRCLIKSKKDIDAIADAPLDMD